MFLLALTLIASEPPPRPATVEVVRDPITDEIRAYATVRDDGNRLVVSCAPADYQGARITFHSRRWLARGHFLSGDRPLIYRFDQQPPRRMLWDIDDRHGTLTRPVRVAAFLAGLQSARRLVIRTRDLENRRLDLVFRLNDVAPAVERAMAACIGGWEEPT